MQILLKFNLNEVFSVKFNYNHQLQSAIYAKLKEAGMSDFLHNNATIPPESYKGFTFGPLKGKYEIRENQLHFSENISFEFRSPDFTLCNALQRSFETDRAIHLFDRTIELAEMNFSNRHINKNECLFKAVSPVIASDVNENGKTTFYAPEDGRFIELLNINFQNKYCSIMGEKAEKLLIEPIGNHRKIVTKYKGIWLNGYIGKYKISGNNKYLEFIYNAGLGKRSSQGFGFIEII